MFQATAFQNDAFQISAPPVVVPGLVIGGAAQSLLIRRPYWIQPAVGAVQVVAPLAAIRVIGHAQLADGAAIVVGTAAQADMVGAVRDVELEFILSLP